MFIPNSVSEIEDVLMNKASYSNVIVENTPPQPPPQSGALLVFDRSTTRNYKDDNHMWVKKKNSHKVREDHVKLRSNGVNRISGCYVHSQEFETFHRRVYHVLPNLEEELIIAAVKAGTIKAGGEEGTDTNFSLVLVHYLDTQLAEEIRATSEEDLGVRKGKKKAPQSRQPKQVKAAHEMPKRGMLQHQMPQQYQHQQQHQMPQHQMPQHHMPQHHMPQHHMPQHHMPQHHMPQHHMPQHHMPQHNMPQHHMPQQQQYQVPAQHPHNIPAHHPSHPQHQPLPPPHPQYYADPQSQYCPPPPDEVNQFDYNGSPASLPSLPSMTFSSHTLDSYPGGPRLPSEPDELDLLDNLDDMDMYSESPYTGSFSPVPVEDTRQPEAPISLADVIDITPENLDLAKLPSFKMMLTLGAAQESNPDYPHHHVVFFKNYPAEQIEKLGRTLSANELLPCVAAAKKLSPQAFKCFPPVELGQVPTCETSLSPSSTVKLAIFATPTDAPPPLALVLERIASALMMGSPLSTFARPHADFIFVSGVSDDAIEVDYENKEAPTSAITLDAPPLAIASIATALADFSYPAPETGRASEEQAEPPALRGEREMLPSRKRQAAVEPKEPLPLPSMPTASILTTATSGSSSSSSTSSFDTQQVLEAWHQVAPDQSANESTIEDDVGRHTKIRFVEKIMNTIGTAESDTMMEDSWSIPTINNMSDNQTLEGEVQGGAKSSDPSNHLLLLRAAPSPPTTMFAAGVSDVDRQAIDNPLEFLDDVELETMDESQLDGILDSLLIRIVEQLVEMSAADSELQEELNAPDKSGFTLLHYASMYNLQALVPVLLSRGANPDTPTVRGNLTPLHLACGADNGAIVELLVRNGCAINVKDSFDMTPADHAYSNGFTELAQWLKEKTGGDIEQRSEDREMELDMLAMAELKSENPDLVSEERLLMPPPVPPRMANGGKMKGKGIHQQPNQQKEMLQNAFTNLSLKDKLAINVLVKKQQKQQQGHKQGGNGGVQPTSGGIAGKKQKQHQKFVAKVMGTQTQRNLRREPILENDNEDAPDSEAASSQGGEEAASAQSSDLTRENIKNLGESPPSRIGLELAPPRTEEGGGDNDDGDDDDGGSENDLSSVFSESDRESLDVALSLLNQNELADLQQDSQKIESNVRAWMLRKNYQTLREAQQTLQHAISPGVGDIINTGEGLNRLMEKGRAGSGGGGKKIEAGGGGKAAGSMDLDSSGRRGWAGGAGGQGTAATAPERKKSMSNVKNQALASLVIRKNILNPQGKGAGGGAFARGGVGVGGAGAS